MPHRFCAICGTALEEKTPYFSMCLNCYLKENPLFELPKSISFKMCNDCRKYSKKEEWIESAENELFPIIEEAISRFLLKSFLKQDLIAFSFSFEELMFSPKDLLSSFDLTITGTLREDHKITHQQTIKVKINYELCKNCSNLRGGMYFLSIIQLRVKNENQFEIIKKVSDDVLYLVENIFKKDDKQYISKMEDQKLGVDLYLSTNELMKHIVSHLKSKYNFILKRTKKLVGRDAQKGRNLYRLKTLIKFLPIKKNDYIFINKSKYFVENITKNRVLLRDENHVKLIKNFYFFDDKKAFKRIMDGD